nr:hypothetical protein [Tanacetum cinerariifolium]
MIHFEQIDLKTFLVNFYTKDGDAIDYVFTKDHEMKCVVVGCHDLRMYQPIPHKMLLNSKVNRDRKCVRIAFNGVEVDLEVSFSVFCKQKTRVGVAFTSLEWERLCNTVRFSTSKAIIITSDESGVDLEVSFSVFCKQKTRVGVAFTSLEWERLCKTVRFSAFNGVEVDLEVSFSLFCKQKTRVGVAFTSLEWERLCKTVRFSASKAIIITSDESGGSFVSKVIKGFFAEMKFGSAADERAKSRKNTNVQLVGEMNRLKQVLELTVGTNNARNGLADFIGNNNGYRRARYEGCNSLIHFRPPSCIWRIMSLSFVVESMSSTISDATSEVVGRLYCRPSRSLSNNYLHRKETIMGIEGLDMKDAIR